MVVGGTKVHNSFLLLFNNFVKFPRPNSDSQCKYSMSQFWQRKQIGSIYVPNWCCCVEKPLLMVVVSLAYLQNKSSFPMFLR
jgi:hypothetical protein